MSAGTGGTGRWRYRLRWWLAALAVVAAASTLGGGCGVPTDTDVRVEGPPPEAGPLGSGDADPPPGPDEAVDEEQLVDFYLRAAASDPSNAAEALREFISVEDREDWQPEPQVQVVRRVGDMVTTPGDPVRVDLTVRRVGALTSNGMIEPQVRTETLDLSLRVSTERVAVDDGGAGNERLRIVDPPQYILLADEALDDHFQERPVYFWDSDEKKLVPDLRWLPSALPDVQRPQAVVDWLVDGPAPWLAGSVASLPDGMELEENVVPGEGGMEIHLTSPSGEVDLGKLHAQLWWTLRPDLAGGTDATVVMNGEARTLRDGYRSSSAVPTERPAGFAIVDGAIYQYTPAETVVPPEGEEPVDVRRAAVSRAGELAAVVQPGPGGEQRLVLAAGRQLSDTELVAGEIGRPVWLNNPTGTGLVVADGELHQFTVGEEEVNRVELTVPDSSVTAVAAAPDGRRLALVADGRLWVASVVRASGVVSVSRLQELPTTVTELAGVAFLREEWLAVVGTADGQRWLYEVTVDGALERELPNGDLGDPSAISSFVAFPGEPGDPTDRGRIMYEADGVAWRYEYARNPTQVHTEELLGEEPNEEDEVPDPRAPFFQD